MGVDQRVGKHDADDYHARNRDQHRPVLRSLLLLAAMGELFAFFCLTGGRTTCTGRGWLLLENIHAQSLLAQSIILLHCLPPSAAATNGRGSRIGRSTCSASDSCSINLSPDSLNAGRSKTTTPSARSPGASRRAVIW